MTRWFTGRSLPISLFLGLVLAPTPVTTLAVGPAESRERDAELRGYMKESALPPELRQRARQVMELRTAFNADAIARNSASRALRGRVAQLRRQCSDDDPKWSADVCTEKTRELNAAIERDNALAIELEGRRHEVESAYQALRQLVQAYIASEEKTE